MDMFGSEQDIKVSGFDLRIFNDSEKLKMELESYGFYFSKHPIALMRKTLSSKLATINKLAPSNNEKYIPVLINNKRVVKKGMSMFVFLEVSDETGIIDVSVPLEVFDEKKQLIKENALVMLKGTVVTDDYRKGNYEEVGVKIRATDLMPIDQGKKLVTSKIMLDIPRDKIKELGNGKFKEIKELNDPEGVEVVLNMKDDSLNISAEIKVDTFRVSLEDNTFEKINEIFGEENYTLI